MYSLDGSELDRLRVELESDRVERKRSASDFNKIRKNICAFSNDLPGHGLPGVIFIGVEDDGACSGATIDDRLLTELAGLKDDGAIIPIPSLTVRKHILSGCEVAVIVVEPSRNPPIRFRGRVWGRVGPTVRQATSEEEQRLSERRMAAYQPFDQRSPQDAVVGDLDLEYIRTHYLPLAVAHDILESNHRPNNQQLRSLRLLVREAPTWGALLGLGRDPRAWVPGSYVQFLRIDGREITDPIRSHKILSGRLEDIMRQLDELLRLNISIRTDITAAAREVRLPDYPMKALQQLARNAVMHRRYDGTNAPVRIYWYSDGNYIRE